MRYRRVDAEGGTYFFTVNLADRKRTLLVDYVDDLRNVMKKIKISYPFHIDAVVIMPDHLHTIWTLPEGDKDYPVRWSLIKAGFSRYIPKGEQRNPSRIAKGERGIWQRRYWEHLIRDQNDLNAHINYIHYNPVKHGLVSSPKDWVFTTFHRYVKEGTYPEDWGSLKPIELPDSIGGE